MFMTCVRYSQTQYTFAAGCEFEHCRLEMDWIKVKNETLVSRNLFYKGDFPPLNWDKGARSSTESELNRNKETFISNFNAQRSIVFKRGQLLLLKTNCYPV